MSFEVHDNTFKLILNSSIFVIPSNFNYLDDVNPFIYKQLITIHQYKVQSNVPNDIFQSFIDNWVFGIIPDINETNLIFFDLLSKEFDRMTDLIKLITSYLHRRNLLQVNCHNDILKSKMNKAVEKIDRENKLYFKIIGYLFNCNRHYPKSKFNEIKMKLQNAYDLENVKEIRDLTQNPFTIEKNGLLFILNEEEKTAGIYGISDPRESFNVPYSIDYKSQNYIVTRICEFAFAYNEQIKFIQFPENSEIEIFEDFSFGISAIEEITIPSKVFEIGERVFVNCDNLQKIDFYDNSELKIIGFEAFAYSSLKSILIPPSVTTICDRVFNACFDLHEIFICENSMLSHIGYRAFAGVSIDALKFPSSGVHFSYGWCALLKECMNIEIIQNSQQDILYYDNQFLVGKSNFYSNEYDVLLFANREIETAKIPSFIKVISPFSFSHCDKLKCVEFENNSELEIIDANAFSMSKIEEITIPSSCVALNKKWCKQANGLFNIRVMPHNSKFIFLDNKYLLSKSDQNQLNYDVIEFATRNIKNAVIPSFIRKIAQRAFDECNNLKTIDFLKYSKLKIIEKNAFSNTSIEYLQFPKNVVKIGDNAFALCRRLKKIDFIENDNISLTIGKNAFNFNVVTSLSIPPQLKNIEDGTFYYCRNLEIIEFSVNYANMISIKITCFPRSNVKIMIPVNSKIQINK